ncbi:MAG: M48 family metalloprotease [Rhodanobacteraceae bacterium]
MKSRLQPWLTFAAILALSLPAFGQQATVRLPGLGSSFDTVMSPAEAQAYGAEFLRELRAAHLVLDDPQIDQYLNALGSRLRAASQDPTQSYTFNLINVPEINSFATFGGYIFIFSGLFTATQTQAELAAVMSHEMSHIMLHHLQQQMENQKKTMPLYLLGALAAGLAASQVNSDRHTYVGSPYGYGYGGNMPYDYGGVDPAMGALVSVMAMMQQHQIEYTRGDEAQADHVGITTLARAGFNPGAMANFFVRMQSLGRPGGEGGMAAGNLPGFLQDHPVTSQRIADARARARVLEKQMRTRDAERASDPPMPGLLPLPFVKTGLASAGDPPSSPSEFQYELMRERIRVLSADNPRTVLDYYRRNMADNSRFAATPANRYGYSLALLQTGKAAEAVPVMTRLVEERRGNLALSLGLADVERHAGQRTEALQRYAALNATWPNDPAIVLAYSRALLDSGARADAKTAQGLLKPLLNDDSEPSLYEAYGHACHVAGDEVHAGIAYADATFLSGHAADALAQLHAMLKRKDLTYYTRAQIDARIAQITPIALEMRRRHLDPDQDGGNSLQGGQTGLHFGVCADTACTLP